MIAAHICYAFAVSLALGSACIFTAACVLDAVPILQLRKLGLREKGLTQGHAVSGGSRIRTRGAWSQRTWLLAVALPS